MSGASATVQQAAEDACTTMQAALASLKDACDASCPAPSRQQVQSATHLLRMEVAKLGLVYNQQQQGSSPTVEEATALLGGFQQAVCTLCMLYTSIAAAAGGPTLRQSLHQTATSVVEACAALIRGAVVGGLRGPQLMVLSGFCLEMLEAAGKAPLNNRTAIGRAITRVLKQLADAQKELSEAVQAAEAEEEAGAANGSASAEQQNGTAAAAAEDDADSDAGFGFEEEAFGAEQVAVARHVRAMLAATVGLVRAVVRQLLAEREGLGEEAVEGWESMLYHVKTLSPLCDDLSAATYPPQDPEELASAAEALATSCALLLEECPEGAPSAAADSAPAQEQSQERGPVALQAPMEEVMNTHRGLVQQLAAGNDDAAQ
ncbi:hypothetical protein CHLNCDRAFT_136928 [Chlorella variabilis]|uniref:Uncharacterized protein n=1 Tax=Chlorella variabilis TaxID=554065 RepID=E1ZLL5_CHLVA|nr:hypothetical protein CHLNCDRAFT_136928 [Chlorella variabilis]EFN53154.1 hypothetical protein CHLNCDRAFT_136928 [Chlorella variabilis]|eukprot:XP_005845256.1 hypothetical protein CHLNCDRAFT_136928 [Chlorella variabilis]